MDEVISLPPKSEDLRSKVSSEYPLPPPPPDPATPPSPPVAPFPPLPPSLIANPEVSVTV